MKIGIVSYLNHIKNEACIRCVSKNHLNEQYNFMPSLVPFEISLSKLICIETTPELSFHEFNPEIHHHLLDLESVKDSLSLFNNRNIAEYLIDNELIDNYNPKVAELNAIKNLIFHDSDGNRPKVKIDIQSLIKNYEVQYIEGGRNKPGEWSRAWLLVHTFRPSNLPDNKLDKYLENLFPKLPGYNCRRRG